VEHAAPLKICDSLGKVNTHFYEGISSSGYGCEGGGGTEERKAKVHTAIKSKKGVRIRDLEKDRRKKREEERYKIKVKTL